MGPQDKLAEAEPLQRSALAIGERMLGSNHSDVATYYNNLSRCRAHLCAWLRDFLVLAYT